MKKLLALSAAILLIGSTNSLANQKQTHQEMIETLEAYAVYKMGQYKKAFEAWMALAQKGNSQGMLNVGNMYLAGEGVEKDQKKAIEWYKKGGQLGDPHSLFQLAKIYQNGNGVEADQQKARSLFKSAAEKGSTDAIHIMADNALGAGEKADAKKWLQRAADIGDNEAERRLAKLSGGETRQAAIPPADRIKLVNFLKDQAAAANARDADLLTRNLGSDSSILVKLPGQSTYQKFSKSAYQDLWQATFSESERYRFFRTDYEIANGEKTGHYRIESEIDEFLYKNSRPEKLELKEIIELTMRDGAPAVRAIKLNVMRSKQQ